MSSSSSLRLGATPEEWYHFSRTLGLSADLLPCVANPAAPIRPRSKMRAIGKTPSLYDNERRVFGIKAWTKQRKRPADIAKYAAEPDYSACLQTRFVRAIDCDIADAELAAEVRRLIESHLRCALPCRGRENSSKFALCFRFSGTLTKRRIKIDEKQAIELLATGQQFIVAGTHPSGARYEWEGGLPAEIPTLTAVEIESLWAALAERFNAGAQAPQREPWEIVARPLEAPDDSARNREILRTLANNLRAGGEIIGERNNALHTFARRCWAQGLSLEAAREELARFLIHFPDVSGLSESPADLLERVYRSATLPFGWRNPPPQAVAVPESIPAIDGLLDLYQALKGAADLALYHRKINIIERLSVARLLRAIPAPGPAEIKAARRKARREMRECECYDLAPPAPLLVSITGGAGKTHQAVEIARELVACGMVIWFLLPTHEKADELLEENPDLLPVRGRAYRAEDEARRLCHPDRLPLVERLGRLGLPIAPHACAFGTGYKCPHFETCGYQKQQAGLKSRKEAHTPGIYLMPHDYLSTQCAAPAPDLIIVDEHPSRLAAGRLRVTFEKIKKHAGSASEAIIAALKAPGDTLGALHMAGITAADLKTQAAALARGEADDIKACLPPPNAPAEAILPHLERIDRTRSAVARLLRVLAKGLRRIEPPELRAAGSAEAGGYAPAPGMPGYVEPPAELSATDTAKPAKLAKPYPLPNGIEIEAHAVTLHYVKKLNHKRTPTIILDATADPAIVDRLWPGTATNSKIINVERQAKIIQIYGRGFSKQSLTGERLQAGQLVPVPQRPGELINFQQGIAALAWWAAKPCLIVCPLSVEPKLREALGWVPDLQWAHFGNLKGLNRHARCASAIIVGREQPSAADVERATRALFAQDALGGPLHASGEYVFRSYLLRAADSSTARVSVPEHPDPRVQRVLRQIREAEIIQALDRLRLVHSTATRPIYILGEVPLPLEIAALVTWESVSLAVRRGGLLWLMGIDKLPSRRYTCGLSEWEARGIVEVFAALKLNYPPN